jgi:hypothetical protein
VRRLNILVPDAPLSAIPRTTEPRASPPEPTLAGAEPSFESRGPVSFVLPARPRHSPKSPISHRLLPMRRAHRSTAKERAGATQRGTSPSAKHRHASCEPCLSGLDPNCESREIPTAVHDHWLTPARGGRRSDLTPTHMKNSHVSVKEPSRIGPDPNGQSAGRDRSSMPFRDTPNW